MPWRKGAKKGAASGETLRGAASKLRTGGTRMGEPTAGEPAVSYAESIGIGGETGGTETSKYPEEKKSIEIPQVAASERGGAQTHHV